MANVHVIQDGVEKIAALKSAIQTVQDTVFAKMENVNVSIRTLEQYVMFLCAQIFAQVTENVKKTDVNATKVGKELTVLSPTVKVIATIMANAILSLASVSAIQDILDLTVKNINAQTTALITEYVKIFNVYVTTDMKDSIVQ